MLDYAREKREKKKDAKKIVWILGALAIVFVVIITRFAIGNSGETYIGAPTKEIVYTIAKDFVRPTLKKGDVDFLLSGYKFTKQRDSVYIIHSSVKITDDTGFVEETYFEIVLKYKGGATATRTNWEVMNLNED